MLSNASCAPTSPASPSPCAIMRIITVAPDDVLTATTAREILSNNRAVQAVCGK